MEPANTIGVPGEVDPALVDQAYKLALAEGGGTVVVLLLAIGALWKWSAGLINRVQAQGEDARKANEALMTRLVDEQAKAIAKVSEAVGKVEQAVIRLDGHFSAAVARLDKAEDRLADHDRRLVHLEVAGANESGARRRPRASGD